MKSTITICNMALAILGVRSIASLEERTPEAVHCARHFDMAREEVLREHPWNFAQSRIALAEVALPATWAREYARAYVYPAACLQLHAVIDQNGRHSQHFCVARDGSMPLVLTNQAAAMAAYTADVRDPARFDALFARCLASRLACHLYQPLLKSGPQAGQALEQAYLTLLGRAKTADAREGRPFASPDPSWDGGHDSPWVQARMACYARS